MLHLPTGPTRVCFGLLDRRTLDICSHEQLTPQPGGTPGAPAPRPGGPFPPGRYQAEVLLIWWHRNALVFRP